MQAVSAPPHGSDPLLSTTVLPYLENLHYPSSQPDLITEHDLHRYNTLPRRETIVSDRWSHSV